MDRVRCSQRGERRVAVDGRVPSACARAPVEAVERAAARRRSSSSRRAARVEVAAEGELQREGRLVVGAGVVGEEQLDELRLAARVIR